MGVDPDVKTLRSRQYSRFVTGRAISANIKLGLRENPIGNLTVENISEGGICISLPNRLSSNEKIRVSFVGDDLPNTREFPCSVVWQEEQNLLQSTELFIKTGIKFIFAQVDKSDEKDDIKKLLAIVSKQVGLMSIGHSRYTSVNVQNDQRGRDEFDYSYYKKIRKSYDRENLEKKVNFLSHHINKPLIHIRGCTYDTSYFKSNIENPIGIIQIPLGLIGPLMVNGKSAVGEYYVPIATTEGALVLTYDLGARLVRLTGGIKTEVISKNIHLDPMFIVQRESDPQTLSRFIKQNYSEIKKIAESKSSHTTLLKIQEKLIGKNYVLKCIYDTGDAHGLNMINEATFNLCKFISSQTSIPFYHRSHYSGVKHHALLNEKEGYGRTVKASAIISSKALEMLGVNALLMKDFFDRCIECGTSAGISSVNVHAANAIAAIFLATGQDMADMTSAGVCSTTVEPVNDKKDLYIQCILKNLLMATVGGGTGLGTQNECLEILGCVGSGKSDKLAEIIAATVLAGEFPTAAAVINETYVEIHNKYGRNKGKLVI